MMPKSDRCVRPKGIRERIPLLARGYTVHCY